MNAKTNRTILLIAGLTVTTVAFQNCSKHNFAAMSAAEAVKLEEEVFVFDSNTKVADVEGAHGSPSENLRVKSLEEAAKNIVQDCTKPVTLNDGKVVTRYDYERSTALLEAKMDAEQKTVPVEFAVSFGQAEDRLAFWAHTRAILSEGNEKNISIIPVGQKNNSMYSEGGKNYDAYYAVNHEQAKNDYIYGKRCFFGTVKITGDLVKETRADDNDRYDFINAVETDGGLRHKIHYMAYGYCSNGDKNKCANEKSVYGVGNYGVSAYPNRLFNKWPHTEGSEPQIVKLFVADLRDGQFGLPAEGKIVKLSEDRERGTELEIDVKQELNLRAIFKHRDSVVRSLSSTYKSKTGQVFAGMKGVPQLLTNLQLSAATGTVLASQYTPIVLDLGREKVTTSDAFNGTFFNMAGLKKSINGKDSEDVPHQTAWLGGDLKDVQAMSNSLTSTDSLSIRGPANLTSSLTIAENEFPMDVRRIADDGFLVMADEKGQVTSSRQLFGDKTVVNGKTYSNGFEALQALSEKDCTSIDAKKRYFGPWDGELYASKVKVWVDGNRNGSVDANEVKTLKAAGVVAINTCNITHKQVEDTFGNGTSLRSAFLFQNGEDVTGDEAEILKRLETGKKSSGGDASFRLAIDLIFKANEGMTLE